jgi:hypothetical protein
MGWDSRGHWKRRTLVVETANFNGKAWNRYWNWASDENMRLVERFTCRDANTLDYEFTVDDPTTWTRPWTARYAMTKSEKHLYECACLEGKYSTAGATLILI